MEQNDSDQTSPPPVSPVAAPKFATARHALKNGETLVIREAGGGDAGAVLDFMEQVAGESEFLTFGPGELELTEADEKALLDKCRPADNQLYIMGLVDGNIIGTLGFSGGPRPRLKHSGELGLSVRKAYWGTGAGGLLLDALITWAGGHDVIHKINLRVRTDNSRAIRLYERKGFVIEGTIQREICLNGRFYDSHWMGLAL